MSTEPKTENDSNSVTHAGIVNWPSALMLALWLLVILGLSGISSFALLGSPNVLGTILVAAVFVTAWSAFRFFKGRDKG
jgi:hypothetical protein